MLPSLPRIGTVVFRGKRATIDRMTSAAITRRRYFRFDMRLPGLKGGSERAYKVSPRLGLGQRNPSLLGVPGKLFDEFIHPGEPNRVPKATDELHRHRFAIP